MIDYNENLLKAKEHWEKEAGTWEIGRGIHWVENIAVQNRINLKVSGRLDQDPYQWLIGFLKAQRSYPVERCLTLGCGTGELERGLQKYQFSKIYDAFDIADLSINIAQKIAKNNNINTINYKVVDINNLTLAPNTYDVVFGIMSVHHFLNLEHIFSEVKKTLKQGGVFFLNEFIGPSQFQWTDRQLELANGLLHILPKKYKNTYNNTLKVEVQRPSISQMNSVDPSEAIRSGEIVDILSSYFKIIKRRDYGGTILHLLLEGIAFNFDINNKEDIRFLNLLFEVEDCLLELDDITSDFSVIIAQV